MYTATILTLRHRSSIGLPERDKLNEFFKDGWEYVDSIIWPNGVVIVILKKPKITIMG
jgi:hypothetical protein